LAHSDRPKKFDGQSGDLPLDTLVVVVLLDRSGEKR
jgi:hypothetical protein